MIATGGRFRVNFQGEETCGFDNPHVGNARGCRLIDEHALMCRGFGVIDGVLFAGGCEAPATVQMLEITGTVPVGTALPEPGPQ